MSETTIHYRGRYLDLVERDGWEYSTRSNASAVVVIVAVTRDRRLLLVEQFRKPVGARVIDLPAWSATTPIPTNRFSTPPAGNCWRRPVTRPTRWNASWIARVPPG